MSEESIREILRRQETMAHRQEAMSGRLESMHERQEAMSGRLDSVDERMRRSEAWQDAFSDEHRQLIEFLGRKFEAIDARFGAVDARFGAVDARFEALEARVTANGVEIEQVKHRLQIVAEGVRFNGERIDRLTAHTDGRFDRLSDHITGLIQAVIARLDRLEPREGI